MSRTIFELFFTFSDYFTSHVFNSKSRYIRRLIFSHESDFDLGLKRDYFREWRDEIYEQLNQTMNEVTSKSKTQQLHDEIVVFEIFISHDYFEILNEYSHIEVSFIRHEIRKALNEYLTTLLKSEVDDFAFCRSSSSLSNDLAFAWESFSLKKMKIRLKFERLVLIVKEFQNELTSVSAAAKKYEICRNIILNRSRVKRTKFEYVFTLQLLVFHEETIILEFVDRFIELDFFFRLFMLREKVELILREREIESNLKRHWFNRFLIRHLEYRSKFFRHLDQKRHFNSDSIVLQQWFELFRKTCDHYHISCENIYNMNEKNFMMRMKDIVRWVSSSYANLISLTSFLL
jgi:cell division protein ZapA (FtsZ GTPase activity inhibitor)